MNVLLPKYSEKGRNFKLVFVFLIASCLGILHFWIMIRCPYIGDDWFNANSGLGNYYYSGESVFKLTVSVCESWIKGGRFFPLSFYVYWIFTVMDTLFKYRVYLFVITILMIVISGFTIYKLTKNEQLVGAFLFLTPIMYYLNGSNASNPLISYHGLVQLTVIYLMCSLLFILKWMDTNHWVYGVIGGVIYFLGLSTYEVSFTYILFLVFGVSYRNKSIRKSLLYLFPVLAATCLGILINILVRILSGGPSYEGISFSFSIVKLIQTLYYMMASAFPTYAVFSSDYLFQISDIKVVDLIVALLISMGFIFNFYLFKSKKRDSRQRILFYAMGLSLWICPGLLVALSARYQQFIHAGISWLPYFAEVVGVSMLIVQMCLDAFSFLSNLKNKFICTIFKSLLLGFFYIVIFSMILLNRTSARSSFSEKDMEGYTTIQHAFESGIASAITKNDVIHVFPSVISEYEAKYFYSRFAEKQCNAVILQVDKPLNIKKFKKYKNSYTVRYIKSLENNIFVLGQTNYDDIYVVSNPKIYIDGIKNINSITYIARTEGQLQTYNVKSTDLKVSQEKNGILVQLHCKNLMIDSIKINAE